MLTLVLAALTVLAITLAPTTAGAQLRAQAQADDPTTSTTRTTLVPGEAAVTEEGSPRNDVGLAVGAVAVGAIVVGAGVLYFRYRGRGNTLRPNP
jgi:hypothetical protein